MVPKDIYSEQHTDNKNVHIISKIISIVTKT